MSNFVAPTVFELPIWVCLRIRHTKILLSVIFSQADIEQFGCRPYCQTDIPIVGSHYVPTMSLYTPMIFQYHYMAILFPSLSTGVRSPRQVVWKPSVRSRSFTQKPPVIELSIECTVTGSGVLQDRSTDLRSLCFIL